MKNLNGWFVEMITNINFLQDTRTAAGTSLVAIGTGITMTIDMIPDSIGKLSALMGCILTGVLIYNHIKGVQLKKVQESLEKQAIKLEEARKELFLQQARSEAVTSMLFKLTEDS